MMLKSFLKLNHLYTITHLLLNQGYALSMFEEQLSHSLQVQHDLVPPQLRLPEQPVHEHDGHFGDGEAESPGAHEDLHLEGVPFGGGAHH